MKKNSASHFEVTNLDENGLDWLCYLAGNFQTAPMIFFISSGYIFLNDFIKNPQTRNAHAILPINISAVGKGGFYSESAIRFLDLEISKIKYSKKLSIA